jgi:hypothetical protein
MLARANGRTIGSRNCRDFELESSSHIALHSSAIGRLQANVAARQTIRNRIRCHPRGGKLRRTVLVDRVMPCANAVLGEDAALDTLGCLAQRRDEAIDAVIANRCAR